MAKSVLITGCSAGGMGYVFAQVFQARGLTVFATARSPSKMVGLEKLPGVHLLSLDVTDPISVAEAVDAVKAKTGGKLDYLINNSGRGYVMPALDCDIEEGKKLFEVNFWGVLRMVQSFAPLLMEAKGTIVNISSGLGLVHSPYSSIYNASKAALNLYDETLRIEIAPLGVGVLTVVVGAISTTFLDNNPIAGLPPNSKYHGVKENIERIAQGKNGMPRTKVEDFAQQVVGDVLSGMTGKTYRGAKAGTARFASALMPTFMMDRIITEGSGLHTLKQ